MPLCREHSKSLCNVVKGFSQSSYEVCTWSRKYKEENGYTEKLSSVSKAPGVRYCMELESSPVSVKRLE